MSQAVARMQPASAVAASPTVVLFMLVLLATMVGIGWVVMQLRDPAALPIRRVQIEGEFIHLNPDHLQRVVVATVDAGFFGVDVARIRQRLLDEPWIRDATIRRVWPETLRVSIVEQVPVARWDETSLLNEAGEIFTPPTSSIPQQLALLSGPPGSEGEVLERFRAWSARLHGLGLHLQQLRLSARHAWTLFLDDGREIELGRREFSSRLDRFVHAYAAGLRDVWERIGRVDLRYTNGVAVSGITAAAGGAAESNDEIQEHEHDHDRREKG